jgi:hypothetical protein
MVDIYLIAKPLALASLPSHTHVIAFHNTLESIYNIHLPSPCITISPPFPFTDYAPHSSDIHHRPLNATHPIPTLSQSAQH